MCMCSHVPDGASIVSHDARNLLGSHELLYDLQKLELSVRRFLNTNELESSLGVVENAVAIDGSLVVVDLGVLSESNDVHETGREARIGANLTVDLNQFLHADKSDLSSVQSHLQSVTKDKDDGKALAELVRSGAGTRSPSSSHFIEHPMLRGIDAFQVFLRSAGLCIRTSTLGRGKNRVSESSFDDDSIVCVIASLVLVASVTMEKDEKKEREHGHAKENSLYACVRARAKREREIAIIRYRPSLLEALPSCTTSIYYD